MSADPDPDLSSPPPPASTPNIFTRALHNLSSLVSIPAPLKTVFDAVPLRVYAANALPGATGQPSKLARLYVFSTPEDAAAGRPSFNPECLKWQVYLRVHGVGHTLVPSSNHASPTGALPFLIPPPSISNPSGTTATNTLPVPSQKLQKYAQLYGSAPASSAPPNARQEAYQALLDGPIRSAWLYNLYLHPLHTPLSHALYINPTTSSLLARTSLATTLHTAAIAAILSRTPNTSTSSSTIDVEALYSAAFAAFEALALLLGDDEYFFGGDRPGVLDVGVFAYVHLLMVGVGVGQEWKDRRLAEGVRRWKILVAHWRRVGIEAFGQGFEGAGKGKMNGGAHGR